MSENLNREAEAHIVARRWAAGADVLSRIASPQLADLVRMTLCRNLASLQSHRPQIYERVMGVRAGDRYSVAPSRTGHLTIVQTNADGSKTILSPQNDPAASLSAVLGQIQDVQRRGQPLALCGLGDGYLLSHLSRNPPQLILGREQALFVIEPELEAVLATLMVHDLSGPRGPIEQERVLLFVGPTWAGEFRQQMFANLQLPFPLVNVTLSPGAKAMESEIQAVLTELLATDKRLAGELREHYRAVMPNDLAPLFTDAPPRKPRVLLITTRFSTVLQFSTRDSAEAFDQLGWETRILIEDKPHHGNTNLTIRHALLDFKPDLIFQIDHLRGEYKGLFPPQIPFACWIQDHLPHLKQVSAGQSVTRNDFVLTDAAPVYVRTFAYPARQCIGLNKLTRVQAALDRETDGDDLVFVSHASQIPARLLEAYVAKIEAAAEIVDAVRDCGREMIESSEASGASWPTYMDVRALLRTKLEARRTSMPAAPFDAATAWLCMPFNNALYRQQALSWAAQIADERGLSLALYGNGWADHPTFAKYARGPVGYGDALERLTRSSKINLQIVPFLALHQRLLDGFVSEGFFLVRTHPADVTCPALINFIDAHLDPEIATVDEALRAIDPAHRAPLEELIRAARPSIATTEDDDPIQMMRAWQQSQLIVANQPLLPRLSEVSFNSAAELGERIARFIDERELREQIVAEQRAAVVARFGYVEGIRRVVDRVGALLGEDAAAVVARGVAA